MNTHQPDSALWYFLLAYKTGMPDDSLYYFWAELYIGRGVLDSALALNLAVTAKQKSRFLYRIYKQRKQIYQRLKWNTDAEHIQDTLSTFSRYRRSFLLPDISLSGGTGYREDHDKAEEPYPYHTEADAMVTEYHPLYSGEASLLWGMPFVREGLFELGMFGRFGRDYLNNASSDRMDSLDFSAGFTGKAHNLFHDVSLELSVSGRVDYAKRVFYENAVSLFHSSFHKHLMHILFAQYEMELFESMDIRNHSFASAMFLSGFRQSKKWSMFGAISCNGYFTDSYTGYSPFSRMYIERAHLGGTEQFFQHYYDGSFETPIPLPTNSFDPQKVVEYKENTDVIVFENYLPQSYLSFGGDVGWNVKVFPLCTVTPSINWIMSYYLESYRWFDFDVSLETLQTFQDPTGMYLAYSKEDNAYFIAEQPNNLRNEAYYGPLSITRVTARRIDNRVQAKMDCTFKTHAGFRFSVESGVARIFSTLSDNAPVDIPHWDWRARVQAYCDISLSEKIRE